MEQRTLVKWLKILVLFAAVCGLGLAGGVLPLAGQWLVESYPEFSYCFWPWLIFLWVLSIPCFWALYLAWKIFGNIEKDHAFTTENAEYMGRISFLAAADAVVLLVGNVLFCADWYESSRNTAFVLCGHADRYWIFCSGSSIVSSHSESG